MLGKNQVAAVQRAIERRRREDASPRLKNEIPALSGLRVVVSEHGGRVNAKHSRHIIVAGAPALFVFECGDEFCRGGGHDLTASVLASLRALRTTFDAHHACAGTVAMFACPRLVDLTFYAEYA